jgi:hypothetical protein
MTLSTTVELALSYLLTSFFLLLLPSFLPTHSNAYKIHTHTRSKGYSWATVVELLSTAFQSGPFGPAISGVDQVTGKPAPMALGNYFLAIDVEALVDVNVFKQNAGNLLRFIRDSQKDPRGRFLFLFMFMLLFLFLLLLSLLQLLLLLCYFLCPLCMTAYAIASAATVTNSPHHFFHRLHLSHSTIIHTLTLYHTHTHTHYTHTLSLSRTHITLYTHHITHIASHCIASHRIATGPQRIWTAGEFEHDTRLAREAAGGVVVPPVLLRDMQALRDYLPGMKEKYEKLCFEQ